MSSSSGISEDYTKVTELCYEVIQLIDEGKRALAEKRAERDKKAKQVADKRDREAASIKSASMETVAKGVHMGWSDTCHISMHFLYQSH